MKASFLGYLPLLIMVAVAVPLPDPAKPHTKLVAPASASEQIKLPEPAKMGAMSNTLQSTQQATIDQWGRPPSSRAPSLLIAVMTAPSHKKARASIMETWARAVHNANVPQLSAAKRVDIKFFVGLQDNATLDIELNQEPSMVRLDSFVESYQNLTRKTLGIIGWAKDNDFDTMIKVDDDTFLRVDLLLEFLERLGTTQNVYSGHFQEHGWVIDNPDSKWFMRDQYEEEIYPPYAFGPCYFLGEQMVDYISRHRYSLFPYRVEDAGVAIWTQDQLELDRVEMPQLLYHARCMDAGEDSIFISPVNAQEMYTIQENLDSGSLCGLSEDKQFVLEECQQRRCLCWPPPEEGPDCYGSFSNTEYADVIPRL